MIASPPSEHADGSKPSRPGEILPPRMNRALILSAALHGTVILLLIVGLPWFKSERKLPESISVELASVSDLSQSDRPPVQSTEKPDKEKEPTKIEKKTPPKPPPTPEKPEPKPEVKPEPKPEPVKKETAKEPPPDELAPPKKVPKKPEKKPEEKKPKEQKPADSAQFSSLLKNLTKDEPTPETDPLAKVMDDVTKASPSPETQNKGANLSMSEMDALRQQLGGCWNIQSGAQGGEEIAVDIRVLVNPDRTVKEATIVDQTRYNTDGFFRAAADGARRAVLNPNCSPLNLPPEKYDLWHDLVINFNPKDMF